MNRTKYVYHSWIIYDVYLIGPKWYMVNTLEYVQKGSVPRSGTTTLLLDFRSHRMLFLPGNA